MFSATMFFYTSEKRLEKQVKIVEKQVGQEKHSRNFCGLER
jgi:hypothetical protein